LYGDNNHHIVEGIFKGLGRAMAAAVKINADDMRVPSTKGVL
ncbi:MAG: imidazoleglycerol-phosphate dehydratase, partial [Eubacteriaceae bacterium]|nr:imidazoleglycerol-phosphate dehydratase [Eubacteriaceae bacterium]